GVTTWTGGVHRLDLGHVLAVDHAPLELHRRRELLRLRRPLGRQDREPLELLDAREVTVRSRQRTPDPGYHLRVVPKRGHRLGGDATALRPRRRNLRIEDDEHGNEVPRVPDGHGLADDWAGLGERLQVRRRDVLARRRDDQLLLAIDDPELTVRS